jgi:hypothetical protein
MIENFASFFFLKSKPVHEFHGIRRQFHFQTALLRFSAAVVFSRFFCADGGQSYSGNSCDAATVIIFAERLSCIFILYHSARSFSRHFLASTPFSLKNITGLRQKPMKFL